MIEQTWMDKDYNEFVRNRFPLPAGYREIEYGEKLSYRQEIIDRHSNKIRHFIGWREQTGEMKVDLGNNLICGEQHCWYLVRN